MPTSPFPIDDLERDRRVNDLLEQCLDLEESEWNAYLQTHCDDPSLRDEVLELLAEDLGDFLETPVSGLRNACPELGALPLVYFGSVAAQRGDHDQAKALLKQALGPSTGRDEPDLTRAVLYRSLGSAYRAEQRFQDAISSYRRAIDVLERCPDSPTRRQELSRARYELAQAQGLSSESDHPTASVLDLLS